MEALIDEQAATAMFFFKRVGCGFSNQVNYERRILAHATARDAA